MVTGFFKIFVIIMIVAGVLYAGTCVYGNFLQKSPGDVEIPSVGKARYELKILNTNNMLYTDEISTHGSSLTLNGYWEHAKDNKYVYRDNQLILDQGVYGTIIIRRR